MTSRAAGAAPPPLWRRVLPSTARTRIIGWVLLLVMAALGVVTFVTWRLLVSATDARMDDALRIEVQEFTELTSPGMAPRYRERLRTQLSAGDPGQSDTRPRFSALLSPKPKVERRHAENSRRSLGFGANAAPRPR
jgi:hypothetical protein